MTLTLKDVAEAAGLSTSAVSRSFTPGAPVSDATRTRVLDLARRMGYRPNRLASGLASGRTRLVGLITDDLTDAGLMPVLDLFTQQLQSLGLRPILMNLHGTSDPDAALHMVQEYNVDVAVLLSSSLPLPFVRAFGNAGIPVVHAFARASDQPELSQAGIKDSATGRLAARILHERGYQKLGFIGGDTTTIPWRDRFAGFRNQGEKWGHPVACVEVARPSYDAAALAVLTLVRDQGCDGIFCGNGALGVGAVATLRAQGYDVPSGIGVLALGDTEAAALAGIELTTLRQPIDEIITATVEMVEAMLSMPDMPPRSEVFQTELIERSTLRAAKD